MWKFALRNLLSRKMRSLLALAGLTVAIMGMVGLFAVAGGLNRMVDEAFNRIPGLVAMQPGAPIPLFSTLPAEWGNEIARIDGVHVVTPEVWQRVNLIDGNIVVSPPRFLFGTDIPTRLALDRGVHRDALVAGRFLSEDDRGTFNAVVSRQIAEEYGKGVGETLDLSGQPVTIVGIYHFGSLLLDIAIVMDIDAVRRMTRFGPDSVSSFYIEPTADADDDELTARIQEHFRGRELPTASLLSAAIAAAGTGSGSENPLAMLLHAMGSLVEEAARERGASSAVGRSGGQGASSVDAAAGPAAPRALPFPLQVRTADDWAEQFEDFSGDLDIFLLLMTGIGVTIAVLSIVNTMLMSVTERIIEFGILKANGWTRGDVLRLIGSESALLGLAGGVCGCIVGWIATQVVNEIWSDRIQLYASPGLLLFSLAFATALGLAGGLYPAVWAMRMMPMDAIRRG
ncbi:MAG: ABC transporter permease [Planctomycetaceae bacterium]